MSSPNFDELMSKAVEETERPKPLPAGSYVLRVDSHEFGESSQKKTPFVRFFFTISTPSEDVEAEELEGINWQKKKLRYEFYLTEDALYRLRDFFEKLGLDFSGRTFSAVIPEAPGLEVVGVVNQTPSNREGDDSIYNNITSFVSV